MPELPEVETVRRGLESSILGKVIEEVQLRRGDLRTPFPVHFAERLAGKRITALKRRAKYLLVELDGGLSVIAHLGMSGRFTVHSSPPEFYAKHDHVVFHFLDSNILIYNDARRFGLMELAETEELEIHPFLAHLGPEPLEETFSAEYLAAALARRKSAVKVALMDQEVVVGVGNIYASEALFEAGLDPSKAACEVSRKQVSALHEAIQKVLQSALESGGSSLRDFFHADGSAGYFQHAFAVYDRAGMPCIHCEKPIETVRQAGRSTFFCRKCQK